MDGDMQVDPDSEKDTNTNNFVFSSPGIIHSPDKTINFGANSDNAIGNRSSRQSDFSAFKFAKPAIIDRNDFTEESGASTLNTNFISPFSAQDNKKTSSFSLSEKESNQDYSSPFFNQEAKKVNIFSSDKDSTKDFTSPFFNQEVKKVDIFARSEKEVNTNFNSPFGTHDTKKIDVFSRLEKDNSKDHSSPFASSDTKAKEIFSKKDKESTANFTSIFSTQETKKSDIFSRPDTGTSTTFVATENKNMSVFARLNKDTGKATKSPVSSEDKKKKDRSPVANRKSNKEHSSGFSIQDIKKTDAFSQLEKNSKKNSDVKLELNKSISCIDVPDSLLVKAVAKEYFDQFGETLKITIRPKRKMITVYYPTIETVKIAYERAGSFLGHDFKVEWTTSEMLTAKQKKKETVKGKIASFLNMDDEVMEELEALKGLEYNLPDPQNVKSLTAVSVAKAKVKKAKEVANKETPKRMLPLHAKSILKPAVKSTSTKPILKVTKVSEKKEEVPIKVEVAHMKVSSAQILEWQNTMKQSGTTADEKYRILEARDRLMRLNQQKQQNLATAKVTRGTCPDMCPEKERYMREYQRQVASYEQLQDCDEYRINHAIAVKQYSRSSADQEEPMPHDLRPVKSLKMTMSYLLHEISDLCDEENTNLEEWFHFLWDRTRSIRKDITQQELCCLDSVELVEQCARFHILCSERLCAEEASVFDPKINSENLTKCLQTLKYMYDDLREDGVICKNESEFRAYVILLNLNNGTFMSELRTLLPQVQKSQEVTFALNVYSALATNNYSKFFKLVKKTTYLNGCILLRYFSQVRVKALSAMVKAYCRATGTTEFPLYELIDILGFEDEDEVYEFCSHIGLDCNTDNMCIKMKKENFREPESHIEQGRAFNLVLFKRQSINQSVGECIAGGTLPEKLYEDHVPHNSFNKNGYLKADACNAGDQGGADPYEFINDDVDFAMEQKENKATEKVNAVTEEKKQISAITVPSTVTPDQPLSIFGSTTPMTSSSSFVFKKPETAFPTITANKISLIKNSGNGMIKKTTESTSIFSQSANVTSSFFAKPSQTSIFSIPATKSSPMCTNSPFGMSVSKSIFSGSNTAQSNLFKAPTVPASVQAKQEANKTVVSSTAITERISVKRRLEDSDKSSTNEKKSLIEKEEILKKQQEIEQKLQAERELLQERQRRLQKIDQHSSEQYKILEIEVVNDFCSSIVKVELEHIRMLKDLSEEYFNTLFREQCEAILDEQLFIQDMLIEVDRRLRDKLVLKYCRIWKHWAAKKRTQRREALDNTPVWLQPESLEERAKKLYSPQQKVAIQFARENKRKSLVEKEKKLKQTPIAFVIHVGLKENAKSFDVETNQHSFWKMVVSWPLLENRVTLWRHKKNINKYLSPEDYTLEPIFIQHKPSSQERLDICIRYSEGIISENKLIGTDALLFIISADEETAWVERRLTKAVLSRDKLMPIPLVILVFGDNERDPKSIDVSSIVEELSESGYISEYTVLYEKSVDEEVVLKVFQSATLWLAINKSPCVPLEMDYIKKVLEECLTEELWLRYFNFPMIQGHLFHDSRFNKALNDPNFIINLHNEAVNHIMDIILDPESLTYTDFAPEHKIHLDNKLTYPCTYEYFDSIWKHSEYRVELEQIMSNLVFPPWRDEWPVTDMTQLHEAITNYCKQILPHETSLSITNNIMSDLFLIAGLQEGNYPNFSDVLLHIMCKKISDLGSNTRVVYNKNHIKHFQTLPWWYKSNVLTEYLAQYEAENDEDRDTDVIMSSFDSSTNQIQDATATSTSEMEVYFECNIDELDKTCQKLQEELPVQDIIEEADEEFVEIKKIANDFEKQLEEQRRRNECFEAKLKEALKDDLFNMDS